MKMTNIKKALIGALIALGIWVAYAHLLIPALLSGVLACFVAFVEDYKFFGYEEDEWEEESE